MFSVTPCPARPEKVKGSVNLPQTGQTGTYGVDDDGALKKGAPWPEPRFTDNMNETLTDNLTGLIWAKEARNSGSLICPSDELKNWKDVLDHVACLNEKKYLGYNNWRMPDVNELASLINTDCEDSSVWLASQGFKNIVMEFYWTSSSYEDRPGNSWVVNLEYGHVVAGRKEKEYYIFPVRGGQ